MSPRHIHQLRRIGQLLRTLADDEEVRGDLDAGEMLRHLSHDVHDFADNNEDHCTADRGAASRG